MRIFLLLIITTISFLNLSAQARWDGGGDGTTWQDTANWESGKLPTSTEIVEFPKSATITGQITENPFAIKIEGRAKITFNLDMTVGKTTTDQHTFTIGTACQVILGNDQVKRNFNIISSTTKNGLHNFTTSDSSNITIAKQTVVNITGANNGINLQAPNTTFINKGEINIDNTVRN